MHKENFKKAVALILSASIATGMSISVFAADNSNDKYVTREYAVSEFVQSIGRNNLKGNENVLKSFDDSDVYLKKRIEVALETLDSIPKEIINSQKNTEYYKLLKNLKKVIY